MLKPFAFIVLASSTLITACSMTSLVYDSAPWFVRERIDDYFDLSMAQTRQINRDFDTLFAWHKYEELPQYADFLDRASAQFSDGLSADEVESLIDEVREARKRLAAKSIPIASTFLLSVSDEQLDYYREAVSERTEELREELELTPEERDEDDYDDLIDSLEDWFGDFDNAQLKQIRAISDTLPDNREYWLQQRETRADELVALLRDNPSEQSVEQFLSDWLVEWRYANDAQRQISEQASRRWQQAVLEIDGLLTPKHRQTAMEKLNDYRWDFITLSTRTNSE